MSARSALGDFTATDLTPSLDEVQAFTRELAAVTETRPDRLQRHLLCQATRLHDRDATTGRCRDCDEVLPLDAAVCASRALRRVDNDTLALAQPDPQRDPGAWA